MKRSKKIIALLFCCIATGSLSLFLGSCSKSSKEKLKFDPVPYRSFTTGRRLYRSYCMSCHKQDGSGQEGLYPPLNNSDYLFKHEDKVACIIKYGLKGPIEVNGKKYNLVMSGSEFMSYHEITDLMNYIFTAWDNNHDAFKVDNIKKQIDKCGK